ncbi:MAG: flippase-like domain-containing protein [Actinomycetota bacterium]
MSSPSPTTRRFSVRRVVFGIITLGLIALAFFGLMPALADYDDVWRAIQDVSIFSLSLAVIAAIVNQLLGPLPTMAVIPHLRFGHALSARLASTTAANTIPGGGAVGVGLTYMMLGRRGHTGAEIGAAVALTGIWNNLARMLLPAGALLAAVLSGIAMPSLVDGTLIGVASLVVASLAIVIVLRSSLKDRVLRPIDRLVAWIRRLLKKPADPGDSPSQRFLDIVGDAVGTRWLRLMLTTLSYHLSLYVALLVSLRAVGVASDTVHWAEVLAAFSLVRLISAIPITPGALGVIEVGLTGLLTTDLDDSEAALVAAAVLLYRFLTYALPTVAGAIVAIAWNRSKAKGMRPGRWGAYSPEHFENAVCFRCRIPGTLRWKLDQFALVDCPQCGQTFMSPRLNHDGRLALYGARAYFDSGVYKTAGAKDLQRTWAEGRLDLIDAALDGGRRQSLFEVGCAYGMFLEATKERGYRVEGLEFSPVAAGVASERLGCTIHVGEVVELPAGDHDVVAFWDTIEHVPDPKAFMEAAVRLIRPGGIVALSCPRFDSLPAKVLRTRWWTLKPHKHIWHFTRADLRRLLADVGLKEVRMVSNPLSAGNRWRVDSLVLIARKPE